MTDEAPAERAAAVVNMARGGADRKGLTLLMEPGEVLIGDDRRKGAQVVHPPVPTERLRCTYLIRCSTAKMVLSTLLLLRTRALSGLLDLVL